MDTHNITNANWGAVSKMKRPLLAILPWGATEPHNYHLPYCTDMLTAIAVSNEVAYYASKQDVELMVLPGIPLGSQNPGQIELPYCIHASAKTQYCILRDIVISLNKQGIKKLLIISGHGGNNFKGFIRDLNVEFPNFEIAICEWFNIIARNEFFEEKIDDHAGELETSVMLHYYPQMVDMQVAGNGEFKPFNIQGFNDKVAWIPRNWNTVSKDTGVGCPFKATAEKGEKYMNVVIPKIVTFICDWANN